MFCNLPLNVSRVVISIISSIAFGISLFNIHSATALSSRLASYLDVSKKKINVISLINYWIYALMQPVSGSLSDLIEPGYLICGVMMLAGIGAFVVGLSFRYALSCVGMAIVSMSCGFVYTAIYKILTLKFSVPCFNVVNAFVLTIGLVGNYLAQYLLPSIMEGFSIYWAFITPGVLCAAVAMLSAVFIHGGNLPERRGSLFARLVKNIRSVTKNSKFWTLVFCGSTLPAPYFSMTGYWGVKYLSSFFQFSDEKASHIIKMTSISLIINTPISAIMSEIFHLRLSVLFVSSSAMCIICLMFLILSAETSEIIIWVLLILYGMFSSSSIPMVITMYRELMDDESSATAVGVAAIFPFILIRLVDFLTSIAVYAIEISYSSSDLSPATLKYSIWIVNAIMYCLPLIPIYRLREITLDTTASVQTNTSIAESLINENPQTVIV